MQSGFGFVNVVQTESLRLQMLLSHKDFAPNLMSHSSAKKSLSPKQLLKQADELEQREKSEVLRAAKLLAIKEKQAKEVVHQIMANSFMNRESQSYVF